MMADAESAAVGRGREAMVTVRQTGISKSICLEQGFMRPSGAALKDVNLHPRRVLGEEMQVSWAYYRRSSSLADIRDDFSHHGLGQFTDLVLPLRFGAAQLVCPASTAPASLYTD